MRRRWIAAVVAGAVLLAGGVWMVWPRPPERFPLIELVPADARAYAGFPDYRVIETLPFPGREELGRRLDPARPHLAGPMAFYLDREGEWVGLARLTRASALFAGADVEDGAAVFAQSPAARERHRARRGRLSDVADFRALGSRIFVSLEGLRRLGRRDFSAAGFELVSTRPVVLRGRALYRGETFRLYVERYLQAPRLAGPSSGLAVSWVDPAARVWEDARAALDPIDREKTDHEVRLLERDFLEGRELRSLLDRLGPGWTGALVPTSHGFPALVLGLDVADAEARAQLEKMIHRATADIAQFRRSKGEAPPYELSADGPLFRIRILRAPELRMGPAFSPVLRFQENRLLVSTYEGALELPATAGEPHHLVFSLDVAALLAALRSLAPLQADAALRPQAEKDAEILFRKAYGGEARKALQRQFPEPADLAKFLEGRRSLLRAKVLEDLSRTEPWQAERAKAEEAVDGLARTLSGLRKLSLVGDYTASGLSLELSIEHRE